MASQHIKWDEETIAEHDKLRGTRRKIIEADTPYIVYDQNDDTAVEKSKLNNGITPMSASELSAIKQSEKATSLPPGRKEGEPAKLSPAKSPGGGYSLDPDELSSRLQAAVSGGGSGSHNGNGQGSSPLRDVGRGGGGEKNSVLPHVLPHTLDGQEDDDTYEKNVRALEREYQRLGGAST